MSEPKKRGLASLPPERRRAIQSLGGKTARDRGTLHQFTEDERIKGGKRGGKAAYKRGTLHVFTYEQRIKAGQRGGRRVAKAVGPEDDGTTGEGGA